MSISVRLICFTFYRPVNHLAVLRTSRIPALYIFGKHSMHIGPCLSAFIALLGTPPPNLVLFHSVMYTHKMEQFTHELKSALPHTVVHFSPISQTLIQPRSAESPTVTLSNHGQRFVDPPGLETDPAEYSILYIGEESLALNNILLTHSQCPVYSVDPKTGEARRESDRSNKLLMRRYATMQRARDADVFGILVGTLGVANYLPLISHIRTLITKAQRKFYTISVGKINPAKLANFPEIECYVLVACPENSIVESKEFSRPIVTPYELYLALQPEPTWTGKFVLDFDRVMSEAVKEQPEKDGDGEEVVDEDEDKPQFSLITGKYRQKKLFGSAKEERKPDQLEGGEGESSTLVRLNQQRGVSTRYRNPIGEYLQSRTYQGLDPRYGQEEPSALEQGRSGIPRGYNTDVDDHPAITPEQQAGPDDGPVSIARSEELGPPGLDSKSIDKSTE